MERFVEHHTQRHMPFVSGADVDFIFQWCGCALLRAYTKDKTESSLDILAGNPEAGQVHKANKMISRGFQPYQMYCLRWESRPQSGVSKELSRTAGGQTNPSPRYK